MSQLKKLLSFIVAYAMIVTMIPVTIFADGNAVVYLTVENTTFSENEGAPWEGKLLDNVPIEIAEGTSKVVDVIVNALEESGYSQTGAESGYISDINGLGEFAGGSFGGWMVTLNDWFISAGISEFYVSDGDSISVMFTSEGYGEDLGSFWSNNNKEIADIHFSTGELDKEFSPDVYEYTLKIPAGTENVKITPTAANKNFQTRIYLNTEFSDGDIGKYIEGEEDFESELCGLALWSDIPENIGYFKRTQDIPLQDGDVIAVACGLPYWSSMNGGEFGSGAENEPGTVYFFNVETEKAEIAVDAGVYDYTALTYKENHSESEAVVSETGVLFEIQDFSVSEGTTVLDAIKAILDNAQIEYIIDESNSYLVCVGELSEMDCGQESGWMISVNDKFLDVSAAEVLIKEDDKIKLHYSVEGWGTDIGNYFIGGPVVKSFAVGGVETVITSNADDAALEGNGSVETPFIIPVTVGGDVDITALTATIKTSLHENYLVISEGEGLSNILSENNYESDVTFGIETIGGFKKNYYKVKLTKEVIAEDSGSEDSSTDDTSSNNTSSRPSSSGGSLKKEAKEASFAPDDKLIPVMSDVGNYILKSVHSPSVGSIGGEWAIIGLARSGEEVADKYYESYYKDIEKYVKECDGILHERKYTEYSRVILALTAIGKNPADVAGYNLLLPLADFEKTIWQGINGPVWALIALDCGNYEIPDISDEKKQATRQMYLRYILDSQNEDGGWSLTKNKISDIDVTAMTLQALSNYSDNNEVNKAIEKALEMLEKSQNKNGGFQTMGAANCESSAQVLTALCSLGISYDSPRFVKNGKTVLDDLISYYKDGGFKHIHNGNIDQMATEQAFYSLVALWRFQNNMPYLYKMTDAIQIADNDKKEEQASHSAKSFDDVINHQNREAIEYLAAKGIINGKSDGIFDPENTMTRAEFATIIVRTLGLKGENPVVFTDVRHEDWFYEYVSAAHENGIINGVSDTCFNPHGTITRQEAAVMICRSAKKLGINTELELIAARDILSQFFDYVKTASWAIKELAFCVDKGIIVNDTFDIMPEEAVKRGEIAQMIFNLLQEV